MGKMKMFLLACLLMPVLALGLEPPTDLNAVDTPNDDGTSITVTWKTSASDVDTRFNGYNVERSEKAEGPYIMLGWMPRNSGHYQDNSITAMNLNYYYRVVALSDVGDSAASQATGPVAASQSWFNTGKFNTLFGTIIFIAITLWFIQRAKNGRLFIRRIAGLDAVEEAVGRATEMGRPILYCLGLDPISTVATVAALNILGRVAKKTAEYDTPLVVPTYDPIVHTVAREMVKEGCNSMGRPDLFKEDSVYFVTNDQMGYAAALSGIMAREKPATNFFMGYYYAEALVLAESGAATGAIQIAGTDAVTQLPFFITSCDYTLMGEELYAASAYLSKEPLLVGGLKGQDACKLLIVAAVILGTLWALIFKSDVIYNFFNVG